MDSERKTIQEILGSDLQPDQQSQSPNTGRATLPSGIKLTTCAIFESGMSPISTGIFELLKLEILLIYSMPTYGGTRSFIAQLSPIKPESKNIAVRATDHSGRRNRYGKCLWTADRLKLIYLELIQSEPMISSHIQHVPKRSDGSFWQTRCTCFTCRKIILTWGHSGSHSYCTWRRSRCILLQNS